MSGGTARPVGSATTRAGSAWTVALRLPLTLGVALLATQVVAGGVDLLLASALDARGGAVAVTTFGLITAVAALGSLVLYPLGGALSDATSERFGRRGLWVAIGACLSSLGLAGLAIGSTVAAMAVAYVLAWAALPLAVVALYASVPDRVERRRRGLLGAVIGVATIVGGMTGNILAATFAHDPAVGAGVYAAILLAGAAVFVLLGGERDDRGLTLDDGRSHPGPSGRRDLVLYTVGRFGLFAAYVAVTSLGYYALRDYVGEREPAAGVAAFSIVSAITTLLSAAIAGPWSDRLGRRKPFVAAGCVLIGAGALLPAASPTLAAFLAAGAVIGVGFGIYLSVGTALATLVLPSRATSGRDIGLVGLSNASAQVVAPAAGSVLAASAGYPVLFGVAALACVGAALAIAPIRSVR